MANAVISEFGCVDQILQAALVLDQILQGKFDPPGPKVVWQIGPNKNICYLSMYNITGLSTPSSGSA